MDGKDNGAEPKRRRLKKLNEKSSRYDTDEESEEDYEVWGSDNIDIERPLRKKNGEQKRLTKCRQGRLFMGEGVGRQKR